MNPKLYNRSSKEYDFCPKIICESYNLLLYFKESGFGINNLNRVQPVI